MMRLNKNAIDKFNKLFFEVANYYNLETKLHKNATSGIYAIATKYLECIDEEMVTIDILFDKIERGYPCLFPFIKISKAHIFKSVGDYQEYVNEETFKEINDIIKILRRNRLINTKAKKYGYKQKQKKG